jgi:hypothetical protein
LRYARDAIIGLKFSVYRRRAARNDTDDLDEIVLGLQGCADAEIRQTHLNAILLRIARRQVAGMRVERVRKGVHKAFEDIVVIDLIEAPDKALVSS